MRHRLIYSSLSILGMALLVAIGLSIWPNDAGASVSTNSHSSSLACADTNGNGLIDKDEAIAVVIAFIFQTPISKPEPNFAGTGDDVIHFELTPGDKTWTITHDGASNFVIYLHDDEGNRDLLVNEIGEYSGTILVPVGDDLFDNSPGPATLEIKADGSWTIRER